MSQKAKNLLTKYSHIWLLLYLPIYLTLFFFLERTNINPKNIIHISLDNHIPFIEYFIVPYLLWFFFVLLTVVYFFFANKEEYYRYVLLMIVGMTIFLIISFLYPNGLRLRPTVFDRNNIFVNMVRQLYETDTATNVLPSLHVYNSLCTYIAIAHNQKLNSNLWIRYSSLILTISIVLATMFLKQHSIVDVVAAFILTAMLYPFFYPLHVRNAMKANKQTIKTH